MTGSIVRAWDDVNMLERHAYAREDVKHKTYVHATMSANEACYSLNFE